MSIGGTPSQTSELLLDGVPNATWDGRQAYSPPRDAVQEVRVKAFDSDSSFGHTGGGTLNQVLKTGTNRFHGTLWEYNQPSNLAANSFFNNRAGVDQAVTHFNLRPRGQRAGASAEVQRTGQVVLDVLV